ncbi:nitroreductase family protein [Candidatus Omnitrophota bacterium]
MDIYNTILKRRSIRNFKSRRVSVKELKCMVNAARLAPSTANTQTLEFMIISSKHLCDKLFRHLKWAGYIAPLGGPKQGCEPTAYIIILVNKKKITNSVLNVAKDISVVGRDVGAATMSIILYAESKGIASCWLGAIDKPGIKKTFSIPKNLEVDSVVALGYPKMASKVAKFKGSVKYYLDGKGTLHVPKRPLKDVLHINRI